MSNQLATLSQLAKGLAQSATTAASDSSAFMKFTKFGAWTWGSEDTETEDGSLWAVHPEGFQHGWIGWGDVAHGTDGEKLGEVMIAATDPLPPQTSLPEIKGHWNQQIGMQLICVEGLDKGVKVVFSSNSLGGRKAYQKIINDVVEKITSGDTGVAPVVKLSSEWYKHPKYGKIFTPIMSISEWATLADLTDMLDDAAEDAPKEAKAKAKAEAKAEADVAEVTEEVAPKRTRRTRRG